MSDVVELERPPKSPVETRAAQLLDVRFPQRTVEVMAVPYETPTNAVQYEGRQITEIIARGAFGGDGISRRRIVCIRDHDKTRVAGKLVAIDAARTDGLVVELRMSDTPLGNETLELAADGILGASVGFAPIRQRWSSDRTTRRLESCYLDHVALCVDPAYQGAQVLDVRTAVRAPTVATPNKDKVLAWLFELNYRPDR